MTSRADSMERKNRLQRQIELLFEAKQRRRQTLARLPFERKIQILVELQKMASEIRGALGETTRHAWKFR